MARKLENKQYVTAPGGDYPYGRIKDRTSTEHGTPVNENVYGDFHQFFAHLAAQAGVTLNGQPDNTYVGFQFIEALQKFISRYISLPSTTDEVASGSTNLNDFVKPGIYSITNSYTNKPTGLGATGQLIVSGTIGTNAIQRVIDLTTGAEWYRTYTSPTTYGAWTLVRYATQKIQLTNWNVETTAFKVASYSMNDAQIMSMTGYIRLDLDGGLNRYTIGSIGNSSPDSGAFYFADYYSGQVTVRKSSDFTPSATTIDQVGGFVRGEIIITYHPDPSYAP